MFAVFAVEETLERQSSLSWSVCSSVLNKKNNEVEEGNIVEMVSQKNLNKAKKNRRLFAIGSPMHGVFYRSPVHSLQHTVRLSV